MSLPRDLRELHSRATGQPAYRDPNEELAERRRQQRQRGWDDATPLLRDAAAAYRDVYGTPSSARRSSTAPAGSRGEHLPLGGLAK